MIRIIINITKKTGLIFIGFVLMVSACREEKSLVSEERKNEVDDKIQTVEVVHPKQRSFSSDILISGTAMPNQKVKLYALESGMITNIRKDIGDRVRKGDAIAQLENPVVSQLVVDANAELNVSRAELETIRAQLTASQSEVKVKTSLFNRLNDIYKKTPQLTTIVEVENAESAAQVAKAHVQAKTAMIQVQEQKIAALQQKVSIANKRNSMLTITAPFGGVVSQRWMDNGALVQSGIENTDAMAIVEIQDINPIRLTIPVPESDVASIEKGMEVNVIFPELAGGEYKAKVSRTSGALNSNSKTMEVQIDLDNSNGKIVSGMFARVSLNLGSRENRLSVPVSAQVMHNDVPHIWVVRDEIAQLIPIRKGLGGRDYFEILNAEVTEQDQVITKGKGLIKDGQKVEAILNND